MIYVASMSKPYPCEILLRVSIETRANLERVRKERERRAGNLPVPMSAVIREMIDAGIEAQGV